MAPKKKGSVKKGAKPAVTKTKALQSKALGRLKYNAEKGKDGTKAEDARTALAKYNSLKDGKKHSCYLCIFLNIFDICTIWYF